MGLRDNFKQAAKELMDGPDASRTRGSAPAPPSASSETAPESAAEETDLRDTAQILDGEESPGSGHASAAPDEISRFSGPSTIIAAGTIIRGSIESTCDMELYGEVQGDIVTTKDLKLKGKIQGNATGGNVELYGIHMVGNVTASGSATLDADSEVEGDLTAESVVLNGKVQGNVQVTKRLYLESDAVICGRVSADKLSVEEGAVIQGEIFIGKKIMPSKPAAGSKAPAAGTEAKVGETTDGKK